MDKLNAWETLHFDVLFHGSDWQYSNMYRKIVQDLEKHGVDVVFSIHNGCFQYETNEFDQEHFVGRSNKLQE